MSTLSLLLGTALAADPVTMQVIARAQVGQSKPALILELHQDASQLSADVSCGSARATYRGAPKMGESIRLDLDAPLGDHACTGTLAGVFADGTEGEMPLKFNISVLSAMKLEVPRDRVNAEAGHLAVRADRPPARVEVTTFGPDGGVAGVGVLQLDGRKAGEWVEVQWTEASVDEVRIEVKVYDTDGFWSVIELFPWFYEIPHEDVTFETAQWLIRPSEEPKLRDAMKQIEDVQARYGGFAKVNLYIAGYTDTVGDSGTNNALSRERARAIATWFASAGFTGEIWYQGLGESALSVPTPDETAEERNRRAVYLVAAETPPPSATVPRSDWKRLR